MKQGSRQPELVQLGDNDARDQRVFVRGQRFSVERVTGGAGMRTEFASATEIMVLLPSVGAAISGAAGEIPAHSIAIVAAGAHTLELAGAGEAYILATDRLDRDDPVNAASYAEPDARVMEVGEPFRANRPLDPVRIYPITDIAIPPENGRLRFLQSETMSLNWVEYTGQRGRTALSPHSHADFEQASLAIEGDFIHHVRTPWGPNADLWREDDHVAAGKGTIMVIPPDIIHTTEGVGEGLHILVDIFAPPRRDFIARNWVHNAQDYADPAAVHA